MRCLQQYVLFMFLLVIVACCIQKNASTNVPNTGASAGEVLYSHNCSTCHGTDGTAGIARAANLQKSQLDSVTTLQVILKGKGIMPAFQDKLTATQQQQLVQYVRQLRNQKTNP